MGLLSLLSKKFKGLHTSHDSVSKDHAVVHQSSRQIQLPASSKEAVMLAIRQNSPVTLIHGRAGTGKTTLVRQIIEESKLNHVVVAPTGVAALNAGGQTIHSFFGLPPRMINLDEITPRNKLRTILRRLDFIVIDEISMVRADLMDAIDRTLRVNRGRDEPFGGIPMLLVGDFLQLPPIVGEQDESILRNSGYDSHFAFGAKCIHSLRPHIIELNTVYRQTELEFIDLLRQLREGRNVDDVVATLNALCYRPHRAIVIPVTLTARTASAEHHNLAGLRALRGQVKTYTCTIVGEFALGSKQRLPAPEFLDLKSGARVMLVKNDPNKRWVNGSLGTVTRMESESVCVRLDEGHSEYHVTRESWESVRYEWDYSKQRIEAKVVGTYSQIPLIPAWAITIHKAQGLTLSDVRVDLGEGAFSEGQTYVALSRAKTLDGLSLARPLTAGDVRVNPDLVDDVRRMASNGTQTSW
jgi:ATP-dependent DNA helicase PIF1